MTTPTSDHAALALLRADPDAAMAKYGFIVSSEVYQATTTGGGCLLSCSPIGGGVYRLTAKQGAGDFYFPYINGNTGVGSCTVGQGQSEGVIATTGGMNGCSLQVNKFGANFEFYHDNNGNSIASLGYALPGNMVARVDYKQYAGPLDLGRTLAEGMFGRVGKSSVTAQYQYFCLTVRNAGRWKVYFSSVLEKGTSTPYVPFFSLGDEQIATTLEYIPFKPTITPLMVSFKDR